MSSLYFSVNQKERSPVSVVAVCGKCPYPFKQAAPLNRELPAWLVAAYSRRGDDF